MAGHPHLSARIPRDHWHAIRAVARKSDKIPSEVIREIISLWAQSVLSTPHADSIDTLELIPQTKQQRSNADNAEPIAHLKNIDKQRKSGEKNAFAD
jgi:hypothetical protein